MQTYSKTIRKAILPAAFAGLLLSGCASETAGSEQRMDPDIFSENTCSVSEAASGVSDTNATTFSETAAGSNDPDDATAAVTSIAPGSIEYVATSEPGRCFVLIDVTWVDTTSEEIKNILDLDYIPGDVFLPVLYN